MATRRDHCAHPLSWCVPGNRAGPRSGMTMIEIAIALTILVSVLLGFSQALLGSMVTSRVSREVSVATDGARQVISDLQGSDFDQVFATFNSSQDGALLGNTTIVNGGFAIAGLSAQAGDADGLVGRITFPEVDGDLGPELREDIADARMGMPRDLSGDGVDDALDHSTDYRILPVVVEVDWRGASGPAHIEFKTVLSPY